MKATLLLMCAPIIGMTGLLAGPATAKDKEREVVEVEFRGGTWQIAEVERKANAHPTLLKGDNPPCVAVKKLKGTDPENRSTFLCRPELKPLLTFTEIYHDVVTPNPEPLLEPLSVNMAPTSVPDCSTTSCEARDSATCVAWRRSYLHPYKCYDERYLGNSNHECFSNP